MRKLKTKIQFAPFLVRPEDHQMNKLASDTFIDFPRQDFSLKLKLPPLVVSGDTSTPNSVFVLYFAGSFLSG